MRVLVVLIAIAAGACELKPAPKKELPVQPPPTAATPAAPDPNNPPPMVPGDAGVAVAVNDAAPGGLDAMVVTDRCVQLGSHVAEVLIEESTDPSQRAAYTQDRTRIVRRTAEGCTRDAWSEELIACFLKSKTSAAMQACRKPEPVARPPAPPPPGAPPS